MKSVVLTNVGTPQSPTPEDVGIYLREFLMDENILQIPRPFRDFLVKVLIVPRRKTSSAHKYQRVWTKQGSPLMVESVALKDKLQLFLGSQYQVVLGMQVGSPSLKEAFHEAMKNSSEIYFCPLYPQFAMATGGGAIKEVNKMTSARNSEQIGKNLTPKILPSFYNKEWFIKAQARVIRENLRPQDHLLLSYHGLPISQLSRFDSRCYQRPDCCVQPGACERNCYRAQCLKTSENLKREINHSAISTSFQSRLGPTKWIEPSTESTVFELAKAGVKHVKVACPSFVSDCLETLEEIGMDLREKFLTAGGESFELIPCVNSNDDFVQGLASEILKL